MKGRFCLGPYEYYPRDNGPNIKYNDKGRDHDLLATRDPGAAHSSCNLRHIKTQKIAIIYNNLPGNEGDLFATRLMKIDDHTLKVIAQRMPNYLTFSNGK